MWHLRRGVFCAPLSAAHQALGLHDVFHLHRSSRHRPYYWKQKLFDIPSFVAAQVKQLPASKQTWRVFALQPGDSFLRFISCCLMDQIPISPEMQALLISVHLRSLGAFWLLFASSASEVCRDLAGPQDCKECFWSNERSWRTTDPTAFICVWNRFVGVLGLCFQGWTQNSFEGC